MKVHTPLRHIIASCAAVALAGAVGLAAAPAAQASPQPPMLTVELARSDGNGDHAYVGDLLTYTVTYTNTSSRTLTAFPAEGNLDGMLPPTAPNCRWANLGAGQTKQCTSASHVVTQDDLDAGGFAAHSVWKATADRGGTQVLQEGIVADAPAVPVVEGARPLEPDEATVPRDRADGEAVRLAHAGQYGVSCYRIPAIAEAPNGSILAAYDSRPGSCQDAPQANSIVQRISRDGGKSFETRTVVAAGRPGAGKYGFSDPSYVVDKVTGDVFLFFVKSYDNGWGASRAGVDPDDRSVLQAAVATSHDNGETWSEPRIITADITNDPVHWTSRFAASGHGIQLRYGSHAGRLIQQYTVNNGGVHQAVSVYSDDHGATWHAGAPVGDHMDENKVVELSDGRVMLNSRPFRERYRQVAISTDGGETYGEPFSETQLPDPANNAQITRAFPDAAEGTPAARVLLYSSSSASGRRDGLVRISFDDGATWSDGKLFKPGAMAYSTITALDARAGGGYALFYEGDGNDLMYTRISLDWLGHLSADANGSATVAEGTGSVDVPLDVRNFGRMAYRDVTVTPRVDGIDGWTAAPTAPFALDAGAQAVSTMHVALPADAKAGDAVRIPVMIAASDVEGIPGVVEVRVTDKAAEGPDLHEPAEPVRPGDGGAAHLSTPGSDAAHQDPSAARPQRKDGVVHEGDGARRDALSTTGSPVGVVVIVFLALTVLATVLLAGRHAGVHRG